MDRIAHMLELLDRPAFCAEDGRITAVNTAAAGRQLAPGMEVAPLLTSGSEEYRQLREGCLYLGLRVCGENCTACVTDLEGVHLFTLEQEDPSDELRLLALAAQELREPLSGVMALWDEHLAGLSADGSGETAAITLGLYQLLRLVGNMTPHPVPRMEMIELNALLREIREQASAGCASRGITLTLREHSAPIFTNADSSLLTRAVYNLLSNALKYTAPGGTITIALTAKDRLIRLSVRDSGGTDAPALTDPFTRYRREPGLGDSRAGLGLGLVHVRSAALLHGGAVHLHPLPGGGMCATLSMPIRQEKTTLRAPLLRVDYAGERDPLLIELSDVLPPEFYQ